MLIGIRAKSILTFNPDEEEKKRIQAALESRSDVSSWHVSDRAWDLLEGDDDQVGGSFFTPVVCARASRRACSRSAVSILCSQLTSSPRASRCSRMRVR